MSDISDTKMPMIWKMLKQLNLILKEPIEKFVSMVTDIKPTQVTLVPDAIDAITSNSGWDTNINKSMLKEVVGEFKSHGIKCQFFGSWYSVYRFHAR